MQSIFGAFVVGFKWRCLAILRAGFETSLIRVAKLKHVIIALAKVVGVS